MEVLNQNEKFYFQGKDDFIMKIFITGGTGFIGKFVVNKLNDSENRLLILSRNPISLTSSKNVSFIKSDLERIKKWKNKLENFRPDYAIHLAWEGIPDYGSKNSIKNLNNGLNLIQVLSETGCKKILISGSLWEYGETKGQVSENTPVHPFNAFTAAKNSLNWLGREIAKENNMIFLWTRIFYVYGPGQKETSLIPHLIKSMKLGVQPVIRNPDAKNDFIYVEDVALAILKILARSTTSGVFNIGSGKLTSVKKVIKIISKELDNSGRYKSSITKENDKFNHFYANIEKLKKIGFRKFTSIDAGIKKTINYPQ